MCGLLLMLEHKLRQMTEGTIQADNPLSPEKQR